MNRSLLKSAEKFNKTYQRNSIKRRFVRFLGCVVVFCTTYALILPAITQEKPKFCGLEEHIHNDGCYVQVEKNVKSILICQEPEIQNHAHTDTCFVIETGHKHADECFIYEKDEIICGLEEQQAHTHEEACYGCGENIICEIAENHIHSDECYTESTVICGNEYEHVHDDTCIGRDNLICGIEENHMHEEACYTEETLICENTEEAHAHDTNCYSQRSLKCTVAENHVHSESCFDYAVKCGLSEHEHTDECMSEKELICTIPQGHSHEEACFEVVCVCEMPETEGHTHANECYSFKRTLICGMEESDDTQILVCEIPEVQIHTHTDECYQIIESNDPSCGLSEAEGHVHSEICFGKWEIQCGKEPHTHSLICYSDKSADVENQYQWKRSFSDVKITGNWAQDVVAVAKTQLGYRESTKNYIVLEDGETIKGYSRYGDWNGTPYEDWSAMFASFCVKNAEAKGMPRADEAEKWIGKLSGMFKKAGTYQAKPGDLIFLDLNKDGKADHVGIITESSGSITAIIGDLENRVSKKEYSKSDSSIVGYGAMPENPDYIAIDDNHSGVYDEDGNLLYVATNPEPIEPTAAPTKAPAPAEAQVSEPSEATVTEPHNTTQTETGEEITEAKKDNEPAEATVIEPTQGKETKPEEVTVTEPAEATETKPEVPTVTEPKEANENETEEATVTEPAEATKIEPEEATVTEPTEATKIEPEEATVTEPTEATETEPEEATVTEPAEATETEPEEATVTEPAEATKIEPEEATVNEPTETTESEPEEATVTEPTEATENEPEEATVTEPAEATETEPEEATVTEPAEATKIEPEEAKVNEPTEATETEPEEATVTEPAEATETEPEEATVAEPAETTESEPEEATVTEPTETTESEPEEATVTEPDEATKIEPEEATVTEPTEATESEPEEATVTEPTEATETEPEEATVAEPAEATETEPEQATVNEPAEATESEPEVATVIEPTETTESEPEVATVIEPIEATETEPEEATVNDPSEATESEPEEATVTEPDEATKIELEEATVTEPAEATESEPEVATVIEPIEATETEPEEATVNEPSEATKTEPEEATVTEPAEATKIEPDEATESEPEEATVTEPGIATEGEPNDSTPIEPEENAISTEYICGISEHIHSEECKDSQGELICGASEHVHDETCSPLIERLCELEEHMHGAQCFDAEGVLICEKTEHSHDEACTTDPNVDITYFCGKSEHVHLEECFDEDGNMVCVTKDHLHDETCLFEKISQIHFLCALEEHSHDEACFDSEGNLVCAKDQHTHSDVCYPDEGYFCGEKAHQHSEACRDEEGVLVCVRNEHVHNISCDVNFGELNDDLKRQARETILMIENMLSADQIDEKIYEFELVEDYEGEEEWLVEVYKQVSDVYRRYKLLTPEAREMIPNKDKLLELEYIWSAVPLAYEEIATTISYSADMFTDTAVFVVYVKSGNDYYAFDGNGNAVPITIDSTGTIIADVGNADSLLWSFEKQNGNNYLIRNTATGRYMHAYPNNGSGVTTSGAYSSTVIETNGGVKIRSNSEYAYLNTTNRVFNMTQSQTYAATFNFGVKYECYVWLDGTNGGLMSLGGSPNRGYKVTDGTFVLPDTWDSPVKYAYKLRGWYDIINKKYYAPGSTVTVSGNMVFYADWIAQSYNLGQFNSFVTDTVSTNNFVDTYVFDYSSIFNMYSTYANVSVNAAGHSETWYLSADDESLDFIFRDWDSTGRLSYPNNINSANTNGGVHGGLYSSEIRNMLFSTGNSYNAETGEGVLGKHYVGKGDHLFQYGTNPNEPEHYGYYYYDSHYNAASYNKSAGRFYVYDYLERTRDSDSAGKYADFLPFNSPYGNTNGKNVVTYSHAGEDGEYSGVTHYQYDAKYNTSGNSPDNAGTNYWFGMRTDIDFYLPGSPGTRDAEGNLANSSLYGDEVVFEFSGDDDVWVLVDNRLVLDLGGIHGEENGSINFSNGEVEVNGTVTGSVTGLASGEHTLTLLYLERGSSLSNCKIRFNLTPRFDLSLQKEDVLTRELLNGAEFSVYLDQACSIPAELWTSEAAHERGEDPTNVFVVTNGKADMWGLAAGNTYYIKETKSPDGGYDFTKGIIVMTLNNLGVASYDVIADGGSLTGGFTVHGFKVDLESQEAFMAITNGKNVDETTYITVRKKWNDDKNHSGDSVTVYLVVDGVRIREVTLNSSNNWEYTWKNMPKYYQDGVTEVNYIVQEGTVSGYVGGIEKLQGGRHESVDWVVAENFRNNEIYLIQSFEGYLSASGNKIYFVDSQATAAASSASRWKANVSGNNVYLTNEAGQKIYYGDWRFRASSNPQSGTNLVFNAGRLHYVRNGENVYICNLASDNTGTLNAHTYESASIYTPFVKRVSVEDVPYDGNTYRITNSPVGQEETVNLTVFKKWDLGTLGSTSMYETANIPFKLMENGADSGMTAYLNLKNGWSASFTGLPKYDQDGKIVSYSVKEDWDSPEWSASYGEITLVEGSNNSYVTTVTNVCTLIYMLPETGGCGRTWHTAGGLALILLAVGILLYRRKYQYERQGW